MPLLKNHQEAICKATHRYERYQLIQAVASQKVPASLAEEHLNALASFDARHDKLHLTQLAARYNQSIVELTKRINALQKEHQQRVWSQLKKEHPVVAELDELCTRRHRVTGYKGEQLDKVIKAKSQALIVDKAMYSQLKQVVPQWLDALATQANRSTRQQGGLHQSH